MDMDTETEEKLIKDMEDDLDSRMMDMAEAARLAMGDKSDAELVLMAMVRTLYLDAPEDVQRNADAILHRCTEEYCVMAAESIVMEAKWQSVPVQYSKGIKC